MKKILYSTQMRICKYTKKFYMRKLIIFNFFKYKTKKRMLYIFKNFFLIRYKIFIKSIKMHFMSTPNVRNLSSNFTFTHYNTLNFSSVKIKKFTNQTLTLYSNTVELETFGIYPLNKILAVPFVSIFTFKYHA